jgi:hypothetical protein
MLSPCRSLCQQSLIPYKKPEFNLTESGGRIIFHGSFSVAAMIRHHLQTGPQLGFALLYFISYFAALENCESRVGKLAPSDPLQLFQRVYVAT